MDFSTFIYPNAHCWLQSGDKKPEQLLYNVIHLLCKNKRKQNDDDLNKERYCTTYGSKFVCNTTAIQVQVIKFASHLHMHISL